MIIDETSKHLNPKVSASIITYNQADYIHRAVEGALKQEVDFPYEIIIGDDGSTDGTRDILLKYQQQYPQLIRLLLHETHWEEGIPGRLNNIANLKAARGEYIACCDGDDFWVSSDKLQQQINFLDSNPEFTLCVHDGWNYDAMTGKKVLLSQRHFKLRTDRQITLAELARRDYPILSCTVCYRSSIFNTIPDWFWNVNAADYVMQFMAITEGKIYFLKEPKGFRYYNEQSVTKPHVQNNVWIDKIENDEKIIVEELKIKKNYFLSPSSGKRLNQALFDLKKGYFSRFLLGLGSAISNDFWILRRMSLMLVNRLYFNYNKIYR